MLKMRIWNEDMLKLIEAFVEFDLDANFAKSTLEFCIALTKSKDRSPLDYYQEKRFRGALKNFNYGINGPLTSYPGEVIEESSEEKLEEIEQM